MKLSVIFGVFHMSIGIVLKGFNLIAKNMWLEFFTEVIAGFFILFLLFGWMDILIIAKWFKTPNIDDWELCEDYFEAPLPQGCVAGNKMTMGMYRNA